MRDTISDLTSSGRDIYHDIAEQLRTGYGGAPAAVIDSNAWTGANGDSWHLFPIRVPVAVWLPLLGLGFLIWLAGVATVAFWIGYWWWS
jgi:hypothetical protein